jgi:hypothetical protein
VNVLVVITFLALVVGYLSSLGCLARAPTCTLLVPHGTELADPVGWLLQDTAFRAMIRVELWKSIADFVMTATEDVKEPMH